MITALQSLLAWRPKWLLHAVVYFSVTQAESLRAQRRIAEANVHAAKEHLRFCEIELAKVDGGIACFDADARNAGMELARRRTA